MNTQAQFERKDKSLLLRILAAQSAYQRKHPAQKGNDDELDGHPYHGNFTKGLPHDANGNVDQDAYEALLKALESGLDSDFDLIPFTSLINRQNVRMFISPLSGMSFDLQGADALSVAALPAPSFKSAEAAGEAVELYWMALLRDEPFTSYQRSYEKGGLVKQAVDDLNKLPVFKGPKVDGTVTPQTLFRGHIEPEIFELKNASIVNGCIIGPYISQFLLLPIPFGTFDIEQKQVTVKGKNFPNIKADYMTRWEDFIKVQNGERRSGDQLDLDSAGFPIKRYIRNGRDLSAYVHFDALYEAYLNACLILLGMGGKTIFDDTIPYVNSKRQEGFATFGGPHILTLVTEVATRALKAVWFQKWFVHRRLRPEAFGGLLHRYLKGEEIGLDEKTIRHSGLTVFEQIKEYNKLVNEDDEESYLMPMAFPEGSPVHPAYGAGHATVAAACTTVLKAWFKEEVLIKELKIFKGKDASGKEILYNLPGQIEVPMLGTAKVPDADGFHLVDYTGGDNDIMTIGGELNKLAANIAIGRNIAGVHWHSDYTASLKLGEDVARSILEEQKATYNEINSFQFFSFSGERITI